ncbi:MAG: hypothetical protein ACE5IZ_07155 [Dehalococcoidia bacterium]
MELLFLAALWEWLREWLRTRPWGWPFLWILLIPIVTVPWHGILLEDLGRGRYPVEDVLPTLAPGLLNLVAFLWVLSPERRTQYAALVAGILGSVRLVVPALIYMASGPTITVDGFLGGVNTPSIFASWILWGLSLAAALAFPSLVKADRR